MIATLYDTFKHWSDGGSVWLYSDPHFDDPDCKFMDPDWPSVKDQVKKINHVVKKLDTLVILGDIGNPEPVKWLDGRIKVLILGNHDETATKFKPYFDEIFIGPLFISQKILLSHEPIILPYCVNIHGHDHGNWYKDEPNHVNVCSNVVNFEPQNLKELIKSGIMSDIPNIHRYFIDKERG